MGTVVVSPGATGPAGSAPYEAVARTTFGFRVDVVGSDRGTPRAYSAARFATSPTVRATCAATLSGWRWASPATAASKRAAVPTRRSNSDRGRIVRRNGGRAHRGTALMPLIRR